MTAGETAIRPYRIADLPALQAIRSAAFAPVFDGFRAAAGPALAETLFTDADSEQATLLASLAGTAEILVAERDGEPVGFVAILLDRRSMVGEIGLNAVAPRHQRQGIGGALYARALERMRQAGMRAATVSTGADAAHAPARAAYARLGFGAAIPSVMLARRL